MPKSSHKPHRRKELGTLREFAAALDKPIPTLQSWTKHHSWRWPKRAPWSTEIVPEVLRWAADELERGRPSDEKTDPGGVSKNKDLREQKLRQEVRKLRAQADQAETALAKERGALHDADACEVEAVRRASLYRVAAQNIPVQVVSLALSAGLPHSSAPILQKQIEDLIHGCLRHTSASSDAQSPVGDDAGIPSPAAA